MDREKVVRKVMRCLRLATSANPHEAAAAMRQARALMNAHGLTEADALASEAGSADAATRCQGANLTESLMWLASVVAGGFRCEVGVVRTTRGDRGRTAVRFFGMGADARIAAYAYSVLRRQMEADKKRHVAAVRKAANRTARGERFAHGWVAAVSHMFPAEQLGSEHKAALSVAMRSGGFSGELAEARQLSTKKSSTNDSLAGFLKGKTARLNQGLEGSGHARLEHES